MMIKSWHHIQMTFLVVLIAGLVLMLVATTKAQAPDRIDSIPDEEAGVEIIEHLGDGLPLNAVFTDENGKQVELRDYFKGDKPVIINIGYYKCPMLCGLVLNGMVDSLKQMEWTVGDEFEVVVISVNPDEEPELAMQKKQGYLSEYNRPQSKEGWHFLVGDEKNIKKITDSIGFGYRWNPKTNEFIHKAAIYIITPDGVISRYLYNLSFDPKTVRLSLVEASDGKIGTTIDQFVLSCFRFNPDTGEYAAHAMDIVRVGGVGAMTLLGTGIGIWMMIGKRRRATSAVDVSAGDSRK